MSRQEHEREDLLREATALVERVELRISSLEEPLFVGFRQDGAASFYFGQNCVYHFNTAGELRRAYLAGALYKADQGRLVALERHRTATETALLRRELSNEQATSILTTLQSHLNQLADALASGAFTVTGQFPADAAISLRVQHWLATHRGSIVIAAQPNVI